MRRKSTLWRSLTSAFTVLLCIAIGGSILANAYASRVNLFLGLPSTKMVESDDAQEAVNYFTSEYTSFEDKESAVDALIQEIEGEGAVLLENNGLLPLSTSDTDKTKISIFGRNAVDLVLGGSGSGSGGTAYLVDIKTAFERAGYEVNSTLLDAYTKYSTENEIGRVVGDWRTGTEIYVAEAPMSVYTEDVRNTYAEYGDAAVVVISRVGGEGMDLPVGAYGDGQQYLELNADEKAMLNEVKDNFENIIVLINSSNAMELGWFEEYGVDAALWIGGVGQSGIVSAAQILAGNIVPSGMLVDTYAVDTLSSPAMQNFGDFTFTNGTDVNAQCMTENGDHYLVEKEGIYVGYKYYETRYADIVMGRPGADSAVGAFASDGNWNYTAEVSYPFGYGLSYTTFSQTLDSVDVGDDTITAHVTVTNTGDTFSGKNVVQLYVQLPYTQYDIDNRLEKSAIQLVGFAKTGVLAPGASEQVTIEVDKRDLTSFDGFGQYQTYILEAGDYYFSIGENVHDALNNILAASGYTTADGMDEDGDAAQAYCWSNTVLETEKYSVSEITGAPITVQMPEADLNYYLPDSTVYLSRSDWSGTWPSTVEEMTANEAMIDDIYREDNYEPGSSDTSEFTFGAKNNLALIDFKDTEYDNEYWDDLIDQMTFEEITNMLAYNGTQIAANSAIVYAGSLDQDGPAGFQSMGNCYPSEVVLASTWNVELAEQMGEMLGEDGLWGNNLEDGSTRQGIYAPAMNIHRTPYSGRNFEYYSEDSVLSGEMAAVETRGIQSKGVYCMIKHFAFNDQETNRTGLSTFNTEQALREIYLKPFEAAVVDGGALSVMGSFNRVGCIWSGAHSGLITDILRGEWGFDGYVSTDFAAWDFQTVCAGLEAGTNAFLGYGYHLDALNALRNDAKAIELMRESVQRMLYVTLQTAAVNGLSSSLNFVIVTNWWQYAMYGLIAACAVGTVVCAGATVATETKKNKKEVNAQ